MGAIFVLTEDGERHVSTGKYPYPAGQVHDPEWGPATPDNGMWLRQCQYGDACDIDSWTKEKP